MHATVGYSAAVLTQVACLLHVLLGCRLLALPNACYRYYSTCTSRMLYVLLLTLVGCYMHSNMHCYICMVSILQYIYIAPPVGLMQVSLNAVVHKSLKKKSGNVYPATIILYSQLSFLPSQTSYSGEGCMDLLSWTSLCTYFIFPLEGLSPL